MPAEIVKVTGPLSYQVQFAGGVVHRHVDNLRCYTDDTLAASLEEVLDPVNWSTAVRSSQPNIPSEVQNQAMTNPSDIIGSDASTTVSAELGNNPPVSPEIVASPSTPFVRHSKRARPPPDYYRAGT